MTTPTPWRHEFVQANGLRFHLARSGAKGRPLLLMLHGFPEFWYSWRHQLAEFGREYDAVAVDLRGYGKTERPRGVAAYSIGELVGDIRALVTALGHERCILVGHDWGGAIAWKVAARHPELVERLVILNCPHPARFGRGLRKPRQLLRSWYMFFFQLPALPELGLRAFDYRAIARAFRGSSVNPAAFSDEDILAYKRNAAEPGALKAMVNYYRAAFRPRQGVIEAGAERPSSRVNVPTLLIWGEKDFALGKELALGTERYVKDLRTCFLPDCGHWTQQDRPAEVNRLMREFLQSRVSA